MLALWISLGVLGLGAAGWAGVETWSHSMMRSTPTPTYTVLEADGPFELRQYPTLAIARTAIQGEWGQASNGGFRALAGYIFGGNASGQKLAMTSPVLMQPPGQNSPGQMAFVLPQDAGPTYPTPNAADVALDSLPPATVATIRFGGWAKEQRVAEYRAQLRQWMAQRNLQPMGEPWVLQYNPPWQTLGRRNEVMWPLAPAANP